MLEVFLSVNFVTDTWMLVLDSRSAALKGIPFSWKKNMKWIMIHRIPLLAAHGKLNIPLTVREKGKPPLSWLHPLVGKTSKPTSFDEKKGFPPLLMNPPHLQFPSSSQFWKIWHPSFGPQKGQPPLSWLYQLRRREKLPSPSFDEKKNPPIFNSKPLPVFFFKFPPHLLVKKWLVS